MEYLITESQYHYLKQVLSEQEVVSDELTNKIIDEYQRLIESVHENQKRVKESYIKEFNDPKNFKYFSYPTYSKEWHDGYNRIVKKYCYYCSEQLFNFQSKVLLETIGKDLKVLKILRGSCEPSYSFMFYLAFMCYIFDFEGVNTLRKKINNIFAKYNIKFEVKPGESEETKIRSFVEKNKIKRETHNYFSVNFEKINPPITTTTTTEIQKTIMPEPYFDKNTERAVKAECDMTFVGKKGKTTFDRIHRTSDGKFLGDYDKSLSLDFNIRRFCKK
jgi:hypothetical protein